VDDGHLPSTWRTSRTSRTSRKVLHPSLNAHAFSSQLGTNTPSPHIHCERPSGLLVGLITPMTTRAEGVNAPLRPGFAATVGDMAVAAPVVAIIAVVVAVFAAVCARAQALAAKASLAIEQARHEAELAPRFEAEITGGMDPVLRLRLLPGQLPMTA
jgi:hypothetical protein